MRGTEQPSSTGHARAILKILERNAREHPSKAARTALDRYRLLVEHRKGKP